MKWTPRHSQDSGRQADAMGADLRSPLAWDAVRGAGEDDVFLECDAVTLFDMLTDGWPENVDRCLLHRVDTDFDDSQRPSIAAALARSKSPRVLLVPAQALTLLRWLREKMKPLRYRLWGRRLTFAGYLRTHDASVSLWDGHSILRCEILLGRLTGFLPGRKG